MKTTKANKKVLVILAAMAAISGNVFAAGVNNTVAPNAVLYGAEAYGKDNTVSATATSAFAVGYNNKVSGDNAFVYGNANTASGTNSIAGGEYSKATGRNSVAIGSSAQALQNDTFAIGSQARANGTDALAFGNGSYAENTATVAVGKTVKATGEGALAVGFNAEASASNSIAIGGNVRQPGDVITGEPKTVASGRQSIALGYRATAKGNLGISVGENAYSEGRGSVAIGGWSIASGDGATAVGGGQARANRAVVVGSGNADGVESISMGYYSRVYAEGAVGIGRNVFIDDSATDSVVIGSSNTITKKNVTAIGAHTTSEVENSVALGTSSRADEVVSTSSANIAGKTYNFAGETADGTVSIGGKILTGYKTDEHGFPLTDDDGNPIPEFGKTTHRTITNVAAGRISDSSTDAINGSQLHSVIEEAGKIDAKVNNHETRINDISAKVDKNKEVLGNHEGRITTLENKITDIGTNAIKEANNYTDSQVASVGAQSAALAGLHPLDFNKDDKASYAASVGHYRNANAVAVGAFYRPNERTMISGAVSFGKHIQMNLGVAFKTGKGSEYINEAKSKDSRIEKLEALVEKLTAEVAELKANK